MLNKTCMLQSIDITVLDASQALGTYQEDPANSGEFPAFVKENKHLYFLKVFLLLIANLKTPFCRIHFTTLRAGPYQMTSAVWVEAADRHELESWLKIRFGVLIIFAKRHTGGKCDECGLCSVCRKSWYERQISINSNRIKICSSFSDSASWEFLSGSEWQTDSTLSFECIEVQSCHFSAASVVPMMFLRLQIAVPPSLSPPLGLLPPLSPSWWVNTGPIEVNFLKLFSGSAGEFRKGGIPPNRNF